MVIRKIITSKIIKGTVFRVEYFFISKYFDQYFLYALMVFKIFQSFSLPYTIINFLFDSFKLLTHFKIAHWNPPQNSLLCDWSMLSSVESADLLLAAGKMRKN
jgi:hypothetical protein